MTPRDLPRLTSQLPGTTGVTRRELEDFRVEEISTYEPCGSGDHLYLTIEKRGISTPEAVRRVARALGVARRSVGYAGLKDARAVTIQTLSVEHVPHEKAAEALGGVADVRLRAAVRHGNKLRLGHLRGNRFAIRIRDTPPDAAHFARAVLDALARDGCPHFFGPQRFGRHDDNDIVGRHLVLRENEAALRRIVVGADAAGGDGPRSAAAAALDEGRPDVALAALPAVARTERRLLGDLARGRTAEQALRGLARRLLRLYGSAYQSRLFNQIVADRFPDLGRLEAGDLAFLHDRGAVFAVDDPALEQARADAFEISPSGPLFGTRTTLAGAAVGEREHAILAAEGLGPDDFRSPLLGELRGERRPLRIPVTDVSVEEEASGDGDRSIVLRFTLPRGAFATAVLHEVLR